MTYNDKGFKGHKGKKSLHQNGLATKYIEMYDGRNEAAEIVKSWLI